MYELAYLLGMPVYQLTQMPYSEYLGWQAYFEQRPVGWRDDDRTMKLLQAQGVKAKPETVFTSLAQIDAAAASRQEVEKGKISMANLKRSSLFLNMLSATGGDKLDLT